MDREKVGNLIKQLRTEKRLTQLQLAELLNVSDKTISKWERGLGCPDVSMLPELSKIFSVSLESIFAGKIETKDLEGANMRKLKLYVCPTCSNLLTSTSDASIACCGKKLQPLEPQEARCSDSLNVDIIDNEFYITSKHVMEKSHYITFLALITSDSIMLKKLYPEWDLQTHLPRYGRGVLLWHCNKHGLFYQKI